MDKLSEKKLNSDGIVISSTRPTTVKNRVMSGHHHVIRIDEETEENLNEQDYNSLLKRIEKG